MRVDAGRGWWSESRLALRLLLLPREARVLCLEREESALLW